MKRITRTVTRKVTESITSGTRSVLQYSASPVMLAVALGLLGPAALNDDEDDAAALVAPAPAPTATPDSAPDAARSDTDAPTANAR